jgi:glucokinase
MTNEQQKTLSVGVDIGGSHISCAAVDMTTHTIIEHTYASVDVDNKAPADQIIRS